MGQNRSSAVMQQRVEPHDSLDDYPTMPWGTRALVEYVLRPRFDRLDEMSVWECATNRGFMARPLKEYFGTVHATDIHDYGWSGQQAVVDFLFPGSQEAAGIESVDWIATNPPFKLAEEFILKSLDIVNVGAAFIVRSSFLESVGRYERLFKDTPPTIFAPFVERIPMLKGRIDPAASTATSYCWLVWIKADPHWRVRKHTTVRWIPPCRKELERKEDYEIAENHSVKMADEAATEKEMT